MDATDIGSQHPARYGQNDCEIALGRKSWLFAGSDRGGERAAVMYTLIQTARLNEVDPQAWLADVLARLNDHNIQKLDQLLPWNWKVDRVIPFCPSPLGGGVPGALFSPMMFNLNGQHARAVVEILRNANAPVLLLKNPWHSLAALLRRII